MSWFYLLFGMDKGRYLSQTKIIKRDKPGKHNVAMTDEDLRRGNPLKHIFLYAKEFQHFGIDFISLTEQIDTSLPMGKTIFTMISAIAELERSLISERVRAGIAKARARIDHAAIKKIRDMRAQNLSIRQIARQLGVGKGTVTNYTK